MPKCDYGVDIVFFFLTHGFLMKNTHKKISLLSI